jgi:hypothetical protein
MKNLILTIAFFSFSLVSAFANNNPEDFTIEEISFEMNSAEMSHYDINVSYDTQDGSLDITTGKTIEFVQILDAAGNLEYQLPLFSQNLVLDLDDFVQGDYQVNFLFENDQIVSSSFSKF